MDVACGEYGDLLPQLVSGIENGRLIYRKDTTSPAQSLSEIRYDGSSVSLMLKNVFLFIFPILTRPLPDIELYSVEDNANIIDDGSSKKRKKKKKEMMKERDSHRAPFHTQLLVLLDRSFKTIWRDKVISLITLRLALMDGSCVSVRITIYLKIQSIGRDLRAINCPHICWHFNGNALLAIRR